MAESTVVINLDIDSASEKLAELERRAERVERRVRMAILRLEEAEAAVASPRTDQTGETDG
jgi:hypothetical protein